MTSLEKTPLQSKKFIAYILSNLGSKVLLFWMINQDVSDFVLITTVTAASFIDIGYILGQAALDKYVRIASIDKEEISV
jgi:hypothetical protein